MRSDFARVSAVCAAVGAMAGAAARAEAGAAVGAALTRALSFPEAVFIIAAMPLGFFDGDSVLASAGMGREGATAFRASAGGAGREARPAFRSTVRVCVGFGFTPDIVAK